MPQGRTCNLRDRRRRVCALAHRAPPPPSIQLDPRLLRHFMHDTANKVVVWAARDLDDRIDAWFPGRLGKPETNARPPQKTRGRVLPGKTEGDARVEMADGRIIEGSHLLVLS